MTAIDLHFIPTAYVTVQIVSNGLMTQTTTVGGQTRATGRNLEQDQVHMGGVPPAAGGPGEGAGEGEVGQEEDRNRRGTDTQVDRGSGGRRSAPNMEPLPCFISPCFFSFPAGRKGSTWSRSKVSLSKTQAYIMFCCSTSTPGFIHHQTNSVASCAIEE